MLVLKEENVEKSIVYLSFKVLKKLKRCEKKEMPIYEFYKLCSECGITKHDKIISILCFIFALDLIYFKEPCICLK